MRRPVAIACSLLLLAACSDDGSAVPSAATSTTVSNTSQPATAASSTTTTSATSLTGAPPPPTTEPAPARPATIDELLALGRPIVLAHTAGEDEFPASTLFGFGESVKAGADMLDMNVLLTADGVLVVQHDDDVGRTTNGTGAVASLTYAEIEALDNAYWFTTDCGACSDQPMAAYLYRGIRTGDAPAPEGYGPDDFTIPRLRDVIARFPDLPLNIEIKGDGAPAIAAAEVLADELVELGRAEASVVSSFDDTVVAAFHQLLPDVEISPGLGAASAWVLNGIPLPDGMRILQLPPQFQETEVITPALVAASKAAGYPIWVWPNDRALENLESYIDFLDLGVDGLNINFPAQGVQAVADFLSSQ